MGVCFREARPSRSYQQNKTDSGPEVYMPHFIDCSQKYFQSRRGWQGEIRGKMHLRFQREFEKTASRAKGGGVGGGSWWMTNFVQVFLKRDTTIAQDISWQMMRSLPCLGRDKGADWGRAGNPVIGHFCSLHTPPGQGLFYLWGIENLSPHLCVNLSPCTWGPAVLTLGSRMQRDWRFASPKAIARGSQGHLQGSSGNKWLINYAWLVGLNKQCNEIWDTLLTN